MTPLSQFVSVQFHRRQAKILARCRGLGDDAGAALVELGLMLAFLGVPLLLGTIYFGVLLLDSVEFTKAAHGGAMYGITSSPFAADTQGIIDAPKAETSRFGTSLTVT